MRRKKRAYVKSERKMCLACPPEKNMRPIREFYKSDSPMHSDGFVPWCKKCIWENSLGENGSIDEDKFKNVLRLIDKPFYRDYLYISEDECKKKMGVNAENQPNYGERIISHYMKNIQSLPQLSDKTYADSEKEDFRASKSLEIMHEAKRKRISEKKVKRKSTDKFTVTDEMINLFGEGYTNNEYRKMSQKYEDMQQNYVIKTNLHKEALATYVRFKVKEEMATAENDVETAQKWYRAAQDAANNGKLTPRQMSKSDLQGGIVNFGDIFKMVEESEERIPIFPQFRYQPNDAVDFIIWNYVNYERKLSNLPEVSYEEVYKFYDKKKQEYISSTGDPYGIFKDDPTEKNRESVEKFLIVPVEFRDGEQNG